MKNFLFGVVFTLGAIVVGGLAYLLLGFAEVRGDLPPGRLETALMQRAVHASVRREAPEVANPFPATDENLMAGGKVYLNGCAGCHGTPGQPEDYADVLFPPIPQLPKVGTEYTEAQIFWVVKHGIRRTGMFANGKWDSDEKMWNCNDSGLRMWVPWGEKPVNRKTERWSPTVHTLGVIGVGYRKLICLPPGTINSEVYCDVLRKHVFPPYKRRQNLVYMQDGASAHTSKETIAVLERNEIKVLKGWPSKSPDLNPIENMWSKVKEALRAAAARKKEALAEAVAAAMATVTAADCRGFFEHAGYAI